MSRGGWDRRWMCHFSWIHTGRCILRDLKLPSDIKRIVETADDELLHEEDNKEHVAAVAAAAAVAGSGDAATAIAAPGAMSGPVTVSSETSTTLASTSAAVVATGGSTILARDGNGNDSSVNASEAPNLMTLLMEVVMHLNRGQELVTDIAERRKFAELNCYCARRTRDFTAFHSALAMALYGLIFLGPARPVVPGPKPDLYPLDSPLPPFSPSSDGEQGEEEREGLSPDSRSITADASDTKDGNASTTSGHESISVEEDESVMINPSSSDDYNRYIPDSLWDDVEQRKLIFRLYHLRLQLEYAVGNMDEGDRWGATALSRARFPSDRARILSTRSIAHIHRSNYGAALPLALSALEILGAALPPPEHYQSVAMEEHKQIKEKFRERNIAKLIAELPPIRSADERLIAQVSCARGGFHRPGAIMHLFFVSHPLRR